MVVTLEHGARLLLTRANVAHIVQVYHTLSLELGNDLLGLLVLHHHLVVLSQLLLGGCQLLHLRLDVGFAICLSELVLGDLFLRSSAFA